MKKILVYPCGTEIALEILHATKYARNYEIYGGSSTYDHGRFEFHRHIDHLPFLTDSSTADDIDQFNDAIKDYGFDFIYPAMDGVLTVMAKYRERLTPVIIAPSYETAAITRSKRETYRVLDTVIPLPTQFHSIEKISEFPVFVKPDVGQGSKGTRLIHNRDGLAAVDLEKELCLEYLPGEEFTVDCFTNKLGILVYAKGRRRRRIKNGVSVSAEFVEDPIFQSLAEKINTHIRQVGGWFFQVKYDKNGVLKLLEVSSRIAGASAITRCVGVNLPLLTINEYEGNTINEVLMNPFSILLDRALSNQYYLDLFYDTVYLDYDDTILLHGKVNPKLMQFVFQCHNNGKAVIVISRHKGDLLQSLRQNRLENIFDRVIHLGENEEKYDYIDKKCRAIFIDDSYGERKKVFEERGIPVFDTNMMECLMED